jgi:hypothetical protein
MNRLFPLFLAGAISLVHAETIPTVSITSASGEVTAGGLLVVSLAGPDFTMNFSGFTPAILTRNS